MTLTLVPFDPAPEAVAEPTATSTGPVLSNARRHACTERCRSDGWTPERMATFLEALADTGLITEACRVAGMARSGAYELRNRDPVFASAIRAAQANARPQVADGLLERSITGTVEHYYRDGVLVGERRHYESWLGLAVLKRLDKQAEEDRLAGNLASQMAGDWQAALAALRSGGTAAVPALFAPEGDELDKVDTPPSPLFDPAENVWRSGSEEDPRAGREHGPPEGAWMTVWLPPPGFDGYQNTDWDGIDWYERACTEEEAALLDAHEAAMIEAERREISDFAEAERDDYFAKLRAELNTNRHAELGSASILETTGECGEMDPEPSSG